jgi:transposase
MITKANEALAKQKKHLPYTSLGERQAMLMMSNLGTSNKQIAASLGCNRSTVRRVIAAFKNTGSFLPKFKNRTPKESIKRTRNSDCKFV